MLATEVAFATEGRSLDQATSLPFTFLLCILEKCITPLLVQPYTSLHTIRAQFTAFLYMHVTHLQAFYLLLMYRCEHHKRAAG